MSTLMHISFGAIILLGCGMVAAQALAASADKLEDITQYIPKIDINAGSAIAQLKCGQCHSFEKGESDKKGPNLWGVYNRNIGSLPNYQYSDALKKMSKHIWNYQELNRFLFNVGADAPGTKMAFVDLRDTQERTNVIGWLSTLYDLPPAPAQPAPQPAPVTAPATTATIPSAPVKGTTPSNGLPYNGGSAPR